MELLRRGDSFGSLGVGVPYFRAPYQFWRCFCWLLIGGLEADEFLNGPDVPGELPIPLAHNAIVRAFLRSERDTLLIVEDDHVFDQQIVKRMREKAENRDFDIVCASYTNRRPPIFTVGCDFVDVNEYGEWSVRLDADRVAKSGTQPYDCAALGMVFIRRWILEEMLGDTEPEDFFWFEWLGRNSQDIQFYARVRELGGRVGVDRDNTLGHIGQKVWTMRDFYEWREEVEKTKAEAN